MLRVLAVITIACYLAFFALIMLAVLLLGSKSKTIPTPRRVQSPT